MPAYSFQERFVPMVCDGSKTQTIRRRRKKGFAKKGDRIYFYFGMRTKWCRKLGEGICVKVQTIMIGTDSIIRLWDGRLDDFEIENMMNSMPGCRLPHQILNNHQQDAFAWNDGFRPGGSTKEDPGSAYELMISWWKQTHSLPFIGDVIFWELDEGRKNG